jgi:hypothetical protein
MTITVGNVYATTDGPEQGAIGRLLRYRKPGYIFSEAYQNREERA